MTVELHERRKLFVRHVLQLIAGGVGLGAGATIAADAFKPGASLALILPAFVIGGLSFVFASTAIETLPHDYRSLRELRREKANC